MKSYIIGIFITLITGLLMMTYALMILWKIKKKNKTDYEKQTNMYKNRLTIEKVNSLLPGTIILTVPKISTISNILIPGIVSHACIYLGYNIQIRLIDHFKLNKHKNIFVTMTQLVDWISSFDNQIPYAIEYPGGNCQITPISELSNYYKSFIFIEPNVTVKGDVYVKFKKTCVVHKNLTKTDIETLLLKGPRGDFQKLFILESFFFTSVDHYISLFNLKLMYRATRKSLSHISYKYQVYPENIKLNNKTYCFKFVVSVYRDAIGNTTRLFDLQNIIGGNYYTSLSFLNNNFKIV